MEKCVLCVAQTFTDAVQANSNVFDHVFLQKVSISDAFTQSLSSMVYSAREGFHNVVICCIPPGEGTVMLERDLIPLVLKMLFMESPNPFRVHTAAIEIFDSVNSQCLHSYYLRLLFLQ